MKKTVTVTLLSAHLLVTTASIANEIEKPSNNHIVLESSVLHTFDGASVGINADVVHLIIYARKAITQQLFGIHNPDKSYTGMYTFHNKQCSIQQLVELEDTILQSDNQTDKEALRAILQQAKQDFLNKVHAFMENARNSKRLLLVLIEEDCVKRGIDDQTLLIKWGEAQTDTDELEIFDKHICSLRLFNRFCCDLLNFLGDLLASCPKGTEQFKHLCEKRTKAVSLIPQLHGVQKISPEKREKFKHEFVQYLFVHHLNKLSMSDITASKLEALLSEFEKKSK
jgi:hypothetical protein